MQGHAIFIGDNARPGVRRQQGVRSWLLTPWKAVSGTTTLVLRHKTD